MNPLLHKFPLDVTGEINHNRVLQEYHDLSRFTQLPYRPIVLDHGYFYTDSLTVMDNTGYHLVRDVDFQTTALNADAVSLTGREVCGVLVITNPHITHHIYVDANMVGGSYSDVSPSIVQLATTLLNDTRSVQWRNIRDRPTAFTPSGHLHAWWTLYGFEGYRSRIDDITDLILTASSREITLMEAQLLARYQALVESHDQELSQLQEHIENINNPHQVTKAQVQLGEVANYSIASAPEAQTLGGGRPDRYMNPLRFHQQIEANFGIQLNQHISNFDNPHQVTAQQAGTYPTGQTNQLFGTRLGVDATAVATHRLGGQPASTVFDLARADIPADNVTSGRFPPSQLGEGPNGAGYTLLGDGTWTLISSLLGGVIPPSSPIHYIGFLGAMANARQHVINTYSTAEVGTIVMYHDQFVHLHNYTNGGNFLTNIHAPKVMMRVEGGGWMGPFNEYNSGNNRATW